MRHDTPRGVQLIRAAIADLEDLGELARVRALAREQWADDPALAELEGLLDRRQAELEGRSDRQLPLQLWDDRKTAEGADDHDD